MTRPGPTAPPQLLGDIAWSYRNGYSAAQIASRYDIGRATVLRYLRFLQVPVRRRGNPGRHRV